MVVVVVVGVESSRSAVVSIVVAVVAGVVGVVAVPVVLVQIVLVMVLFVVVVAVVVAVEAVEVVVVVGHFCCPTNSSYQSMSGMPRLFLSSLRSFCSIVELGFGQDSVCVCLEIAPVHTEHCGAKDLIGRWQQFVMPGQDAFGSWCP